ncbi:tRNA-uridine aminocarboxypropyltransferase [Microbulbifer pacificus]|uniref:tRNA-uridine aminocarboxypropyltransferase n=1 Tax=Microbulbifer pacificus TaxID=407164 RepID=UPI000CF545E0|nr:DTW domain-containing protein [Microbulbifer pacificus]
MHVTNFTRLRDQELAKSTRPFMAKGKSVIRCTDCQMAEYACICSWRPTVTSGIDFALLVHRKELFKPTNTGRLIADVFADTPVFLWSRLDAPPGLQDLLQDPARECYIVFPASESDAIERKVVQSLPASARGSRKVTLILLDGSWKQCSRMIALSRWLDGVPCLKLPDAFVKSYLMRDSGRDDRFSTAEAAISCLLLAGESSPAQTLQHYFNVFNLHYLATRGCYIPEPGESHRALALPHS